MKFKSHFYFEEKDRVTEAEKALEPLPGSKITFFKNGECLGTAFTDVFAVSMNRNVYVNYQLSIYKSGLKRVTLWHKISSIDFKYCNP